MMTLAAVLCAITRLSTTLTERTAASAFATNRTRLSSLRRAEKHFIARKRLLLDKIKKLDDQIDRRDIAGRSKAKVSSTRSKRVAYYQTPMNGRAKLLLSGIKCSNEYEMVPFEFYNRTHLMSTCLGVEQAAKMAGRGKQTFDEVLGFAKEIASGMESSFASALHRNIPGIGDFYEVLFSEARAATGNSEAKYSVGRHSSDVAKNDPPTGGGASILNIVRPFDPLRIVNAETITESKHVHVVVSVGDSSASVLGRFLANLREAAEDDGAFSVTVVRLAKNASSFADVPLSGSTPARVVSVNGTSGRMVALRTAVQRWAAGDDVLLFFADVELVIGKEALARCRRHTKRAKSVYYPVTFGLYDPNFVYPVVNGERIPSLKGQLRINENKGRWQRDYYGPSCQYRSDFIKMTSVLRRNAVSWQSADEELYLRYLSSAYVVYRIPDPGVFRLYYPRRCAPLPEPLFWKCLQDKIYGVGSQIQMPFLIFRNGSSSQFVELLRGWRLLN